jgi:hypothetical protein
VVDVNGGELVMESGTITGSNNTSGDGGGVYLMNGGSFTMKGGSISGNVTGSKGGGVYVGNPGSTFTMTGGTITGNTASTGSSGGGVYIEGGILGLILSGTFNLNPPAAAGNISGNAPNQVYNDGGTFKVNGSNGSNY